MPLWKRQEVQEMLHGPGQITDSLGKRQMSKPMYQDEVQTLFRKFATPLAGYAATSPARKELAEMLARNLWTAMIAGPEMEEVTWKILKTTGHLDDDSLQLIKNLYFQQMKPVVTDEQIVALRERYRLRRKE
jgi:hypothetical protein